MNDVAIVAERPLEMNSLTGERLEKGNETSIGHLISVARERKRVAHSPSYKKDQFPSYIHPENQNSEDKRISSGRHSAKGSVSGDNRTVVRANFEEKIQKLTNSKESIKRATRVAFQCAGHGIASEVMELLICKLETEPNFHRRVDLFFLVDSITQGAHWRKGNAAASYIPIVEASLPRLLEAAAPSGAGASENRKQCLKVLQLWFERKILPGPCLQHYVDYFRVLNDNTCTKSFNRHPSQVARAVDDPLRQIEGMLVTEYGSNEGLSFKFSPKVRGSDGFCQDIQNSSAKRFSPPSPLDSPPPTPHLPSSPMPPPPPLSSPSPPPPPPPLSPQAYAPPPPFPAPSSQFTFLNKVLLPQSQPACPTFFEEGYYRWPPVGNVGFQPPSLNIHLSGPQPPLGRPIAVNVGFQPTASRIFPYAHPISGRDSGLLMMPYTQGSSSVGSWRPA